MWVCRFSEDIVQYSCIKFWGKFGWYRNLSTWLDKSKLDPYCIVVWTKVNFSPTVHFRKWVNVGTTTINNISTNATSDASNKKYIKWIVDWTMAEMALVKPFLENWILHFFAPSMNGILTSGSLMWITRRCLWRFSLSGCRSIKAQHTVWINIYISVFDSSFIWNIKSESTVWLMVAPSSLILHNAYFLCKNINSYFILNLYI